MKKISLYTIIISLFLAGCGEKKEATGETAEPVLMDEQYRPQYHFTPEEKWMNDPNGLVYQNGKYHLFFQHYPDSTVWGPMHWGHATSEDLVDWEHQPIALYPDSLGYIFSGSAVIDEKNTAGFGEDAMVAIFTYHNPNMEQEGRDDFQYQGIAYSLDEGKTWTKYSGNPVLSNPDVRDFRDPKVFHDPITNNWKMIIAAGDHLQLFSSEDLKKWEKVSDFKDPVDESVGVWECPDLFPLRVDGTGEEKWVLIISHNPGAPNGGSGTRYFIGDYDGKNFTTDQTKNQWLDYGTDNYAGVTFNNTPEGKRIFIGWMSNWDYATQTPTERWRSAMTLPREIELKKDGKGYFLTSFPVDNLSKITQEKLSEERVDLQNNFSKNFNFSQARISFQIEGIPEDFEIKFENDCGEKYLIGYDATAGKIYTDRREAGKNDFNGKFDARVQQMQVAGLENAVFDIFLDRSSVELFVNKGRYSMTNQIFPSKPFSQMSIRSKEGSILKDVEISSINSIWKN